MENEQSIRKVKILLSILTLSLVLSIYLLTRIFTLSYLNADGLDLSYFFTFILPAFLFMVIPLVNEKVSIKNSVTFGLAGSVLLSFILIFFGGNFGIFGVIPIFVAMFIYVTLCLVIKTILDISKKNHLVVTKILLCLVIFSIVINFFIITKAEVKIKNVKNNQKIKLIEKQGVCEGQCLFYDAIKNTDDSSCGTLEDLNYKNECFRFFALKNLDSSICNKMVTDEDNKFNCVYAVAVSSKDITACNVLDGVVTNKETPPIDYCINLVKNWTIPKS